MAKSLDIWYVASPGGPLPSLFVQIMPLGPNMAPLQGSYALHWRGLYRGFRDTGYLPFYFQGYRILSILLPGTWNT